METILHHITDRSYGVVVRVFGLDLPITKHLMMLWIASAVVLAAFGFLAWRFSRRPEDPFPRGRFENLVEAFFQFIRDEFVRPNLGAHAARFEPFFVALFCLILAMNLLGMVPGGAAATGNIAVTLGLALTVFVLGVSLGVIVHGPLGFLKHFVPSGLPWPLVPFMFVLEIIGFLMKHLVLAIRLFANMLAGHLVILAFLLLISMFQTILVAPVSVGVAVAISFLEIFVAFLQAYVFVMLSSLFVGMILHPEH